MNDDAKQCLSALLDDEGDEREISCLIDRTIAAREYQKVWVRYQLIREVMAGGPVEPVAGELVRRVRADIEREPVPVKRARPRAAVMRPFIGFALAASVATMAILGVRYVERHLLSGPQVAAVSASVPAQPAGNRWNVGQPALEARLNGYLVNHSEYVGYGMGGMFPYARIVGYARRE